jgi:hypothetical protein
MGCEYKLFLYKCWPENIILRDMYILWSLDVTKKEVFCWETISLGYVLHGVPVLHFSGI